jgi:hypothetical protein
MVVPDTFRRYLELFRVFPRIAPTNQSNNVSIRWRELFQKKEFVARTAWTMLAGVSLVPGLRRERCYMRDEVRCGAANPSLVFFKDAE